MLSLEGGYAIGFTAAVIIAVQNALTKSFAILCHTGFQVIIVGGILKKFEKNNNQRFQPKLQKQIGFSQPLQPSRQSVWQGQA